MVKNMHFCTQDRLKQLKNKENNFISTYRTGFIPSIYPGDKINLNERDILGDDTFIVKGKVLSVGPIQYKNIPVNVKNFELKRYNRKFHKEHYFFYIFIRILNKIEETER